MLASAAALKHRGVADVVAKLGPAERALDITTKVANRNSPTQPTKRVAGALQRQATEKKSKDAIKSRAEDQFRPNHQSPAPRKPCAGNWLGVKLAWEARVTDYATPYPHAH